MTDTITGFVNGDTSAVVGGNANLTTTATPGSSVGTYAIMAAPGTLNAANYKFAFADGSLTVIPATLTVTASDASKLDGQTNPLFSVSYAGFVNGDGPNVLNGALSFDTGAATTSPVGTYTVAPTGLVSANYAITFANGILTIKPALGTTTGAGDPQGTTTGASDPQGPTKQPASIAPTAIDLPVVQSPVVLSANQDGRSIEIANAPLPQVAPVAMRILSAGVGSREIKLFDDSPPAASAPPDKAVDPPAAPVGSSALPSIQPPPPTPAPLSVAAASFVRRLDESALLWEELDALKAQVERGDLTEIKDAAVMTAVVAAAGYVLLNGRGLTFLVSLLGARPLWRRFDPLEVLFAWEAEKKRKPKLGAEPVKKSHCNPWLPHAPEACCPERMNRVPSCCASVSVSRV